MPCPSDETFARLVEGRLSESEVGALEAHADVCATCARILAALARAAAPGAPPERLGGRYRLLEPLGAGGMGVVYAALDEKLGRKVAIKRLRDAGFGSSSEKRRARFVREAQLLASLSHPNVLTVFDVAGDDRELYVVMELVDGWALSRWAVETHPGWRRILEVYLQAGRGVVAAHELGIVHRDIKPDNILVARNGRVLVGDFGLAGLGEVDTPTESARRPSPPAEALTETGALLGTPAYMAPEQEAGKAGDALSDQFSFATALYETLHGRRPFAGLPAKGRVSGTGDNWPAPGRDGVPRAIDRLLGVALALDPAGRFASMAVLLDALARAAPSRSRVRPLAVGLLLIALVAGGAAVFLRQSGGRLPGSPLAPATPTLVSGPPAPPAAAPPTAALPARPVAHPTAERRRVVDSTAERRGVLDPTAERHPGIPADLLAVADRQAADRDGAGCLNTLDGIATWPDALAERALERRADCEMLRGHCEAGRKLLAPLYAADRTVAGMADGLLDARVRRTCPAGAFPTVADRVDAVFLQADVANQSTAPQPRWCGALEKVLLRDTESSEVRACFAAYAASKKPVSACSLLMFDLAEAYRHLSECFLRDGDCATGAALDIMHTEVELKSLAPDSLRAADWCVPQATKDRYPSCAAAARTARERCQAAVEIARNAGETLFPRASAAGAIMRGGGDER